MRSSILTGFTAIGIALMASPTPAAAQDAQYDACMKGKSTNTEWSQCGGALVQREEARINAIWKKVFPLLEPEEKTMLRGEQRAWIAFKEQSCDFYATGAYGREGQVLHFPLCRAEVIAHRRQELENLYAYMTQGY